MTKRSYDYCALCQCVIPEGSAHINAKHDVDEAEKKQQSGVQGGGMMLDKGLAWVQDVGREQTKASK